jgi:hypothetical protein
MRVKHHQAVGSPAPFDLQGLRNESGPGDVLKGSHMVIIIQKKVRL